MKQTIKAKPAKSVKAIKKAKVNQVQPLPFLDWNEFKQLQIETEILLKM